MLSQGNSKPNYLMFASMLRTSITRQRVYKTQQQSYTVLKATPLYLPVYVSVCNGVCPNNSKCASNFISTKDKNY